MGLDGDPSGHVYIDTRRQDDLVWVRVADFIPPNIHQFTANDEVLVARNSITAAGDLLGCATR